MRPSGPAVPTSPEPWYPACGTNESDPTIISIGSDSESFDATDDDDAEPGAKKPRLPDDSTTAREETGTTPVTVQNRYKSGWLAEEEVALKLAFDKVVAESQDGRFNSRTDFWNCVADRMGFGRSGQACEGRYRLKIGKIVVPLSCYSSAKQQANARMSEPA